MITIFLLCHNRPNDALHAIQSILVQTSSSYQLIVSDNSSDDRVGSLIEQLYPSVRYVKRPCVPALEHMYLCINDSPTEYFCLFHDDDLMSPDFVEEMLVAIKSFPQSVAIGANAYIENRGVKQARYSIRARGPYTLIRSAVELARCYFGKFHPGIAPFPSYVYSKAAVLSLEFPKNMGKYSDVILLLSLALRGLIVWVNKPLMVYRIHETNDSNFESFKDRFKLLSFIKKNREKLKESVEDYRYFLYKKLLVGISDSNQKRRNVLVRYLKIYKNIRFFRFSFLLGLYSHALTKIFRS